MSKFTIGQKVMLSPNSKWVNTGSQASYSMNPLNVSGVVVEVVARSVGYDGCTYVVEWSNGKWNAAYTDDCLLLYGNYVTVTSLDYMDSDEIDDEDKKIIEQYLSEGVNAGKML